MQQRGILCVLIGTDSFRALAEIEAEARKIKEFKLITLKHPIGGRPTKEVEEKCTEAYPNLVKLLDITTTGTKKNEL